MVDLVSQTLQEIKDEKEMDDDCSCSSFFPVECFCHR